MSGFVGIVSSNDPPRALAINSDGSINATAVAGTTQDVNLTKVGGTAIAIGAAAAAASLPVTASTEDVARQGIITETAPTTDTASSGQNGRLQRIAQRITSLIAQIPAALGQATMANSLAVVLASNHSAIPVTVSSTAAAVTTTNTKSNVSASASSVTVLAANANRLSGAVTNDSAALLYLDESGGTASATSYTTLLYPGDYYELPKPIYRGAITGIWASATGTARVVEGV